MPGLDFDYRPSPPRVFWSLTAMPSYYIRYRNIYVYTISGHYSIDYMQMYLAARLVRVVNPSCNLMTLVSIQYFSPLEYIKNDVVFLVHEDHLALVEE